MESEQKENVIAEKSKAFALRCLKLYQYLFKEKNEQLLSKQLLRSGTSIGANVKEALYAASKRDFNAKMQIALKEAAESEYWLELLSEAGYITAKQFESLNTDCAELRKILCSITKTIKDAKED